MLKPRILVTGATGKTGSVVVAELLKAGYPVRAMVHREDGRSVRLKAQGAEIAVADMSDVERVADALKDVQRAYYCPPFDPYMIQGAVAFAVAARESRLEHIVSLTQWLSSPSHPALMTRQHWLVDRLFSMMPRAGHTIVNPGFFADAYLVTIGLSAHLGIFPWIFGNSRNAPPSNEDIARVAVAALMDPARHAGKSYRPTGPELLGTQDMARAIGRAVGRPVRVAPTPTWMFMKAARMSGYPIDVFSGIRYYIDDHKRGAFELGAPTMDVPDVTGQPAEDFETIARRYAALPRNRRTPGNWLRQFAQFMITPLSPGFDLDRYDGELRRPFPSAPQFAPESRVWLREHALAHAEPGAAIAELRTLRA
ncbi:NmrA family NAD(P)-binding protein [Cupriavidus lacunae]|uniref:Transcriptional regulator n=1 Tax=Cupriavidus lacunae TaxID=2666307 RepID=A0A370P0F3_9BURK|nr:NmrA family NAD(P)-binding protein [Cupriavidus lacunae]RDK11359.1 transcriptional regulator [Cupriavidus lacunae]